MEGRIEEGEGSLLITKEQVRNLRQLNIVKYDDGILVRVYRQETECSQHWADVGITLTPMEARRAGEALLKYSDQQEA